MLLIAVVIVVGCKEDDPIETTGHITGIVTEDGTNDPIFAANVTLAGISSNYKTGDDGKFEIKDLDEGDYTITVEKKGYEVNKKNITVKAGKTTSADFSLKKNVGILAVSLSTLSFGSESTKETLSVTNSKEGTTLNWEVVIPEEASWLSVFPKSGQTESGESIVTVSVDRSKMTEQKVYSTNLIIRSTNGGGSKTIQVTSEKLGAVLEADPTSLNFGTNETEKSIIVKNATKIESLTYNVVANESWISLESPNGTIQESEIGTIKVKVSRLGLAAGNHDGNIVIKSNKNIVTVKVSMNVLAKQAPSVSALQSTEIKHNSVAVSAYISDVGSAAVSAYGFCWGTSPNPTTADNKNNLGGTSTAKSFNTTITGLTANTLYYVRAYATNEEGTSYSDAISFTTATPPTMAVVRSFATTNIAYNKATGKGSIDNLGDGYVTSYGFCISKSNSSPTLSDQVVNLGSTTTLGDFEGTIPNLQAQTKYFVRAFATNSLGTAYGSTVEFTTPITPPLVTGGLLAYYTFDNSDCDDYFGEIDFNAIVQGSGNEMSFVSDTPKGNGKSLKGSDGGKYYKILRTPDRGQTAVTYSVWIKTKDTNARWFYSLGSDVYYSRGIGLDKGKVMCGWRRGPYIWDTEVYNLLLDGQWHHLVMTLKNRENTLYIDGRYIERGNGSWDGDFYNHSIAVLGGFNGLMDNLRIYNRILTVEEIREIYQAKQ